MGAQFTIPLITVIPGQLIASALWNNEFQNINTNFIPAGMDSYSDTDAQMQIQTDPYPGNVTSHASNLGGEIERIRYQISQILGATTPAFWYADPPSDLTTLANISVPIGGSIKWPSATPPGSNWLIRNGQAIGRVAYATLFALIGTTFGVGDGSTTFNIPDDTDKMTIGAGNLYSLGATGGAASATLAANQIPASVPVSVSITDPGHTHTATDSGHTHGVTDPGHVHLQRVNSNASSSGQNRTQQNTSGNAEQNSVTNTASATTGLTVNSGTANVTNAAHTTGVTASGSTTNASQQPVATLPPYIAEYWMIRVL
jgi:hypothetical protein